MCKTNPPTKSAHFSFPSGALPVSFRYAGKVAMLLRDPLNESSVTLPVPFRCPSGILPVCRCFDTFPSQIFGAFSCKPVWRAGYPVERGGFAGVNGNAPEA